MDGVGEISLKEGLPLLFLYCLYKKDGKMKKICLLRFGRWQGSLKKILGRVEASEVLKIERYTTNM